MGLSFTISQKLTGDQNAQLASIAKPAAMNAVIGRKVTRDIIRHFQTYSAGHPNKLGGKRTNYVARMGDATSFTSDASGVQVNIAHEGARLRIEGGTITPKNGKTYLTIPAIAQAYGKRAREFPNLTLLFRRRAGKTEAYALGVAPYTPVGKGAPRRGGRKALGRNTRQVVFWLVKSANIPANRALLLSDEGIMQSAVAAIGAYLRAKGGSKSAAVA